MSARPSASSLLSPLKPAAAVLLVWLLLASASGVGGSPRHPVPGLHQADHAMFPGSYTCDLLASIGTHVLSVNTLTNGSSSLVMFDPATNTSTTVQPSVPGGYNVSASNLVAAGGSFYVEWFDLLTGSYSFEKVTTGGTVSAAAFPLNPALDWVFPYGNATTLFASADGYLLKIDPTTLAVVKNYSSHLPKGATVDAVLPSGPVLYLGGSQLTVSGGRSPMFDYLNTTTHKFTSVLAASTTYPSTLTGAFYSLYVRASDVFAGGSVGYSFLNATYTQLTTVAGLFYDYSTASRTFTNLSGLLPHAAWGVFALEDWKGAVALSLSYYDLNSSAGSLEGGLYTYPKLGLTLNNQSHRLGVGYFPNADEITSETGGYFVSGGENLATNVAEIVALKV